MNNEKKLCLEELKVQSFTTEMDRGEQKAVKGGGGSDVPIFCGRTSVPTFC